MKKFLNEILIQPKIILSIFVLTSVIIFISAFIEYYQSKKEINRLMEEQSHTLLDAIIISSNNALKSYDQIKNEINERLLNNATLIKHLYESNNLSDIKLKQIANENNLFRIFVFSKNGVKVFSSHVLTPIEQKFQNMSKEILKEIFNGEIDTLQIGIKASQTDINYSYVLALAAKDRSAIVINIDANKLIQLRNELGFGPLLKEFTNNKNISYLVFQNSSGIIAASGNFNNLEDIDSSSFLLKSLNEEKFYSRIINNNSHSVFESVHPLIVNKSKLGLIRLGLSIEPIEQIKERTINRTIIQSIFLLLFGVITFSLLFIRQNFDSLSKKFTSIEFYFKNIFENVSDAIIILSNSSNIEAANNSVLKLFNCTNKNELENKYKDLLIELVQSDFRLIEKELLIRTETLYLLISKTLFKDETSNQKIVFVIKDITHQKIIENQKARNKQLTALSDLASSVAHEIRNPLNAIGTITQQLTKDFSVKENENDFKELTKIVYKEIKRINVIIENFLIFAKPLPIKPEYFSISDFLNQLKLQYLQILKDKNISIDINLPNDLIVFWDKFQIKQVFINLFENSIDAIKENGLININVKYSDDKIEIRFSDNGKGMEEEITDKIFNIYFTTKPNGNGIGLSIVQKIITEHNGIINLTSRVNEGTTFTIILPKEIEVNNG
ncbi:MAG: ATP-binding protein [Melioribacteraceae bacterium]|nr:ATP-binding protein [Melioribacteraceae bacterium]